MLLCSKRCAIKQLHTVEKKHREFTKFHPNLLKGFFLHLPSHKADCYAWVRKVQNPRDGNFHEIFVAWDRFWHVDGQTASVPRRLSSVAEHGKRARIIGGHIVPNLFSHWSTSQKFFYRQVLPSLILIFSRMQNITISIGSSLQLKLEISLKFCIASRPHG